MFKYLTPLFLFIGMVAVFIYGLDNDPSLVPSPLIDKPSPEFALPDLHDLDTVLSVDDLKGKVVMLNVWASWCVACRTEHPLLVELEKAGIVDIYGLNYKDEVDDAIQWLKDWGNPYAKSLSDLDGRVGIDFGVYGVPETFILDKQGVIRYKHIGPISSDSIKNEIVPLILELKSAS
jgi:cytochrome c biogenesis protein CcmG/thiol:disulfide interchange protein DsbE